MSPQRSDRQPEPPVIELFHAVHSTCAQKVRICLEEKGLPWTGHLMNLRRFDQLQPEFLALNPAGMVPVLREGGRVLAESRVINEYLEDAWPQVRLAPADPWLRARMRLWTQYAEQVPSEAVKLPSFVKNIVPGLQAMPRDEALALIAKIPVASVRARWHKGATEGISQADLAPSIAQLAGMVERMDRALADGPWLAGPDYSLADIDIAPFVQRLVRIELFHLVEARPAVADWWARISSRPAYLRAMPRPGSEGDNPGPAPAA
jgi:glutathione S-transferase